MNLVNFNPKTSDKTKLFIYSYIWMIYRLYIGIYFFDRSKIFGKLFVRVLFLNHLIFTFLSIPSLSYVKTLSSTLFYGRKKDSKKITFRTYLLPRNKTGQLSSNLYSTSIQQTLSLFFLTKFH